MKKLISAALIFSMLLIMPLEIRAVTTGGKSAILIEANTGEVIYEKNSAEKLPMASTTKIITAIVAIERGGDLTRKVKISGEAAGVEGSSIYLAAGEELTLEQLLYALMLESANDAAAAIACEVGGSIEGFSELMNEKARALGLDNTHFTNPHGLDDDAHYTTASDLAKITADAMKNEKFAEIVSTYKKTIPLRGSEGTRVLINHNRMLRCFDGATGVKTGFTKKSGRCLVSAAERDGITLVAVTLSDPSDWRDHTEMLEYGFAEYENVTLALPGELSFRVDVAGGQADYTSVVNREGAAAAVRKSSSPVKCRLEVAGGAVLFAPVRRDSLIAEAVFEQDGKELARVPLYASEDVAAAPVKKGFFDFFK